MIILNKYSDETFENILDFIKNLKSGEYKIHITFNDWIKKSQIMEN